ncbi:hypothetical protein E4U61_001657 [Claviceps capensis]|nr:hypothetical protein E4U61_001657 [Claviceps capensis]
MGDERAIGFKEVRCGRPRGSPLSLVLYLLSLAKFLALDTQLRLGYADDMAVCRVDKDLEKTFEALRAEGGFDARKYKLIHITPLKKTDNPSIILGTRVAAVPDLRPIKSNRKDAGNDCLSRCPE